MSTWVSLKNTVFLNELSHNLHWGTLEYNQKFSNQFMQVDRGRNRDHQSEASSRLSRQVHSSAPCDIRQMVF